MIDKPTIESVYHLTNGISNKQLNKLVNSVKNYSVYDYIPNDYLARYNFINKDVAIRELHNPSNIKLLKQAKLRTIYEEFFVFMFKMNY